MELLHLRDLHLRLGARFSSVNQAETVNDYGDFLAEHSALRQGVGFLDLSFRSRLCLTGADRVRFLHGQVTNDIKSLPPGAGCYAALATAKGKMESDLYIFRLSEELLLDFEPGLTERISGRLESFIVADDVQLTDVAPHYGLLSLQGPNAGAAALALEVFSELPAKPLGFVSVTAPKLGEVYLMNQPRLGTVGFDLFVPVASLGVVAERLLAAVNLGGCPAGWQALETARIEAGIPRFGQDMDETTLPLECGIEARAVSYSKGCYIGQEIINRVHTHGHVTKELRSLRLADSLKALPDKGDKLFHAGKEAGYITSAAWSPALKANIALGYVRREANAPGTELTLRTPASDSPAQIIALSPAVSLPS
jgi:folate-binding protein YgfZ